MTSIDRDDAIRLRLAAHGLSQPLDLDPVALVDRAGALQGQELSQVIRSIAIRVRCADDETEASFGHGIVRSWPMRGTLFATTPDWLAVLLSLTGERLERMMVSRRARLGLDEAEIAQAAAVAAERLAQGPASRAQMLDAWADAGIELPEGRGYHLIVSLAIQGRLMWADVVDGEQVLVAADLSEVDDDPVALLGRVAVAYAGARGPVTIDDLAWWTKLPKSHIRTAIARVGDELTEVDVDGTAMFVGPEALDGLGDLPPLRSGAVWLLPRFDEWYLGYQNRTLVASPAMTTAICPKGNGVFRPLVVVDGQIVATWGHDRKGAAGVIDQVEPVSDATARAIDAALDAAGR